MQLKQVFICVFVLVTVVGAVGLKCRMESFQTCPSYGLISTKTFQGFVSPENFNSRCKNMKMALDCAQSNSYLVGCSERDLLEYNMVKSLQTSMCEQYKTEYKENAQCITSETVRSGVDDCVYEISVRESEPDLCRYLGEGLKCVQKVTDSAGDGICVGNVLVKIVSSYLLPLGRLYNCTGFEPITATSSPITTFKTPTAPATAKTTSTSVGPLLLLDTARDESVLYGESRGETNAGSPTNQWCTHHHPLCTYYHIITTTCLGLFIHFVRNVF